MKNTPKITEPLRPYQFVNSAGEVIDGIRYVPGQPLNIRFNGQSGRFSRDGQKDLGDTLTVTPVAWRFFTGSIFGRADANYAELYYVDGSRNLAVVLFTNASAQNLQKFAASLQYIEEGNAQTLCSTVVHIRSEVRVRKDGGRYNVATFTNNGPAKPEAVHAFRCFCLDKKGVFRADTCSGINGNSIENGYHSATYRPMWALGAKEVAAESDEERRLIQQGYK